MSFITLIIVDFPFADSSLNCLKIECSVKKLKTGKNGCLNEYYNGLEALISKQVYHSFSLYFS